jgi:NADH/NAD ratio-sensing transcriptional regulator Rex
VRKRGMQKLQTAEMRFLSSAEVSRLDNIRKCDIRKDLRVFSMNARIRRYTQNWLEHVERMEEG